VPPITLVAPLLPRVEARGRLGLPLEGRVLLVAAGGGGDETATTHAAEIARAITRLEPATTLGLALGPLSAAETDLRRIDAAPLAPFLAAFDGAFAPAGYNTAHELALAGVPAALFAEPRPFDDQAARAARFETAGHATVLRSFDDAAVRHVLETMKSPRPITPGGADRAAEALLDLATAGA